MQREIIKRHLLSHQVKPSLQRLAIMAYLHDHRTHPTAEAIYNDLSPEIPTLSRTTVYNTLKLLADNGAIQILAIDERNARFDADISEHAHFRCKDCGCIYDVRLNHTESITPLLPEGTVIEEEQLYYKGYCKACNKKRES